VIEVGCGTAVPTMRWRSQSIFATLPADQRYFIRINIDEATAAQMSQSVSPVNQTVPIAARSIDAVQAIDNILRQRDIESESYVCTDISASS